MLYSGWGTRFVDVDNDGLRDLFVAQSHVLDTIEKSTAYLKYKQPLLLMRNTGKGFVNISATAGAAFNSPVAARGAAFGDLNNDGQLDAVIAVLDDAPLILRNMGTQNHWLGISLAGSKSNRNGIGARVTVTNRRGAETDFRCEHWRAVTSLRMIRASLLAWEMHAEFAQLKCAGPAAACRRSRILQIDRYHPH